MEETEHSTGMEDAAAIPRTSKRTRIDPRPPGSGQSPAERASVPSGPSAPRANRGVASKFAEWLCRIRYA